jgi:hypothetical protein
MQGLGEFAKSPLAKMALRYWWVSIPLAYMVYGRIQDRRAKEKKIKPYMILSDVAATLGPVMTLVAMSELANKLERSGKLDPVQTVREAEFQTVEPQQPATEGAST